MLKKGCVKMSETLAIYGGKPAVDVSKVVNWPPINEIDEKDGSGSFARTQSGPRSPESGF